MNQFLSRVNRFVIALIGVLVLGISSVYAGTAYTNGRAFLKQGSPTGGGKVYVASNATEPTSGQYKAVTSSTSPAFNVQVAGDATFHYWAVANPGYIFTGWYTAEGALQSSGAAHISKKVTAGQAGGSDTHAYADFYASFIKQIQLSFVVPTNGSFTITHKGSEVTPAYSSFTTEGKVVLTALPADGYKLRGWYTTTNGGVTKNYFAFGNSCEPNFTSNTTIGAEFVPDDGKATFWIKGTNFIYDNLTDANTKAASVSSKMIVVVSDGIVVAGTYTISSGVTLLIPYEETYNLMTKPNIKHIPSPNAASKVTSIFRKLTLASGATINVSGNICIGGSIASCNGGSPSSFPTGSVGMLDLSRGGVINLASGSNLYAWGYVKGQDMDQGNNTAASGVGEINAASGATVWEDYQVGEWRGGTASSTIYNNKGSWKFFPFQSYSVQNIEAPVNYAYGSNCKCYWTIFGNGSVYDVNFPLIASSGSLFKLASGGTVRKWYDPTTDHVCFEMGGTAALDALTLSVMGETVTSSDYYLPIPANLKIVLKSGNNLTVSKPMTMHAGSVVEVKSGATLTVNNRVHLFDADDWDTYCMYAYYYRTYYSPSLHFNRGEGTAKTTLEDATVIVDGTVDVKGAYLYSSAHGSNICGNGGGTFKYAALPSNTTMTQCKVLKDNVSVNIRSANLHNDNDTYTKGIASTTFKNVNGRWFTNAKATEKANHTYDFTYIKSGDVYGTGGTNATVAACWSKDRTGLELQNKWANIQAEGCADWWKGIDDSHLYNWTRNSAWHQYIKSGSTTTGSGDEAVTTDIYAGSDNKLIYKTDCTIEEEGTIDANCLYTVDGVKKALVDGSFIAVTANATPDHGYHATASASTYYLCFDGCVWHPATRNAENRYTVDGTVYIWYNNAWLAVQYDSTVSLYYSLSATNVKIYYEYIDHVWTLAVPVAEVITSAGTEQVFSLTDAITKAKAGGTNVTIRLLKDMTVSSAFTYDGTNNCGLDLNGYTLTGTVTNMITVNNASATLIIKDQSPEGNGKIQAKFSKSDNKVYGLNVTKGHIILNGGTVHVENTHASQGACGVVIKTGHKFTINGGTLEVASKGESWGVYTESSTTSQVTVNGGTINTTTTSASAATGGIQSLGGIITINGGTISTGNTTSTTVKSVNLTNANSTLTISGGTITTTAKGTDYGVYVTAGSTATITGGTITTTTVNATARGVISYGTTTISGGSISATAGTTDAKAIYVANNTTTINAGATVNATATSNAYGIYYSDGAAPVVVVNGGTFTVNTTSTTGAYGVYANKGTGTINDGTFTVTAKTTGAEGMHVESTNTPKLTLNGGKFMVKNSDGSADGTINNTGATLANFSMAGGYFNIAPNGTTNIAAGKSVQDVVRAKEQAIYDAGYVKKIRGNEYTVTWKSYNGKVVLRTTQVESGKVPVWTGTIPDQSTSTATLEAIGWTTAKSNGGTAYTYAEGLPAIVDADVTYFVRVQTIYAEVIAGGTTTRYTSARTAWTDAIKNKNATIRVLSNYAKTYQMVFNPTNANSTITLDLNGHYWADNGTRKNQYLLHVNPTQTGCKLIITDNSTSGNGYLQNKWKKADGDLRCAYIQKGELVLQGGALKVINDTIANHSNGVYVGGANAHFTMTGGMVCATDSMSPRGVCVGDGYADIAGGTVEANSMASEAYALLSYDTVTVCGGATLRATGATGSSYGTYCNGAAAVLNIDSAIIISNAYQTAKGIYSLGGGQTTVDGKSSISATTTTGSGAYALYATGANTKITINDGTYTATSALNSAYGVFAESSGAAIVNDGSFTVTAAGTNARGVFAQSNGTATVKDGSFNVTSDTHADPSSFGAYAAGGTVNIEDGNFTLNVHKDLSNRNCDLARCGTGASYLNISGGTFAGDSAYHAVRSFGGETMITGNPVFTAQRGIDAGAWASADGTAKVTIDGGTFYCTDNFALYATTHTYNGKTVVGDMTVLDGKFHTKSSIQPVYSSSGTSYLKIKGGYFTSYTSSNVSNLNTYVVAPSTTTAVESTDPMYASPNDYRYRVNTKFTATWKDMAGNTLKTEQYNRNEIPSYGSEYVPSDGNTYTFNGWSPTPGPIQSDQIYTAQYTKYEAEVTVPGETGSKRYTSFVTAFNEAQNLPVATIKVLSDVYYSAALTLNPDSAGGSKPLTIDLNNHVVNYTPKTATYALTINKAGCKLIIDDSSVAKGGQFGHRQTANNGATISAIYIQNGELELAGGTIIAQNNNTDASTDNSKGTRAVVGNSGTVFTMTGGKLYAKSRFDARAFNSGGTCTFNATGGTIEATCEYTDGGTKWGNNAYGVVLWNYGTFNMSGTATMNVTAGAGALGVYPYGAGGTGYPEVNISGGSITCLTKSGGTARGIQTYGARATTNISGGDITANGPAGQYNIEDVTSQDDATVNITGGNFHSSTGANCVGVRVFSGTVTIGGTAFFDSRHGVVVGDWATSPTSTATAYVNGGTFDCPEYVLFAKETTNEYDSKNHYTGTVTGTMYVNGGYFKTASGNYICGSSSGVGRLILHGGYYNETSGTTQKSNITTYKGATTEVTTLSPVVHDAYSNEYHYELLTDFNITWLGGDSYSKVTQAKSGTIPTNTELEGKSFLRNDSAFYFTGWSPTPTAVTGDATYNAEGVYHEAMVTVAAKDSIFDDFDEAWSYAMEQANATITLLTNLTRTTSIVYNPTPANARHTFDLNNFTIKENTTDRLLIVNKSDAKLTITDNSSAKGGCLYKKMNSSSNMSTTIIYHGEMILAGGKIYVENTKDDKAWHPAMAVHTSVSSDGIFTMTGGTVESQAKYLAYPIYNYATTNISGGTVIANATSGGAALGLYAIAGTATISGGTFNVTASTNATGAIATGWINNDGSITENGVLNITGGTFNVSPTTNNARAIQATGTGKNIGGTIYTAHGIANISGGTFNVACPPVAAATQIFGAVVDGWRLFDGALPHTMIGESRGEMNISGGTFTIDARDNGTWVANSGNVDLLRSWGTLNVSGGNFTLHQYSTPSAISVFRGKTTVSGNPVFNVYGHTGNAYAVCVGYWTSENYCDKDAANNLAEAEINGGTFKIITEGQNTNVIYSLGQISAESRDAVADTITAHAGYAMNAKITVNGGEFLGICPNASGKYPIMLNSRVDQVGTYGTAKSEIYVTGGKFKSRKGTEADNTSTGAVNCHNNVGTLLLTGGYYETSGQLNAQKADTCDIINITSAAIDPEYNNGYRYRIDVHYVAQVTATGVDRKFATLKGALDYAKTLANSTVTLLNDCNFETDGIYGYALGATGKTMTIDLNNHTVNATNSVTSYDRVFGASGQITVTDNSVAKGGKLNLTKNHNGTFIGIVLNDACQLTLANGTIYVENEMASKSATAINIWGTTGIFRQTGGTLQVKATSGLAEGIHMRGTAEISGGNVTITSLGNNARAFAQDADAANSKYSSLTVSGTPTITVSGAGEVSGVYSNIANTSATISGGTWNISSTTSGAYGVRLSKASASASISGGTFNVTTTTTSAYCVYASTSASATVTGGTYNATATTMSAYGIYVSNGASGTVSGGTFTSRNGAGQNECFGAFATGTGTTLDITGGTFDVNSADNAGGNINVVRVQPSATVTISGGTFRSAATGGNALVSFGGVTTVSGTALFEAQTGAYVGSWYQGDGSSNVTATVNLNGGTFNVKGVAINATWGTQYKDGAYLASPFVNSIVNVNGGRYKTTGSAIVSKKADGADGGTAVLNIAGGYFNEKSGTTFKDQISPYVADTSEINTLDPLYEGTYKYEVAPHYVASVTDGVVVTNYTTFKAAFDYAKTRNNSEVTILDDCDFETNEEYGYNLCPSGKTMTLDLNNHTVNGTSTSYDRVFSLSGQLTITDHSGSKNGKLSLTKDYSSTFIGIVLNGGSNLILEEGTIYVENERASQGAEAINIWGTTGIFTQTGGLLHVKASGTAKAFQHRGTINIEGGEVRVVSTAGIAIGDSPAAEDPSTDKIGRSNISGTAHFNITGQTDAYGVYNEYASNVSITGGTFDVTANTTNAYGIRAFTNAATITVNGPVTINTTSTTAMAYSINASIGTVTLDGAIACTTTGETRARSIQAAGTATITVNNGTYKSVVTGSEVTDSYVLIPEGTSAMTVNGGKFHSNKNNIAWANTGAGATLTINGGYFNESSGTAHKNQIATYKGDGKVVLNLDTDDAEYAAGYRYVVTADPVAKVKAGSEVTYYTALNDAFNYAKTQNNAEITILKDIDGIASAITYDPESKYTCTLNLNNHTIAGTVTKLLTVNTTGKLIIDDSSAEKNGTISMITSLNDRVYAVLITKGEVELKAGKIYSKNNLVYSSSNKSTAASAIGLASGSKFTMDEGIVESECSRNSYAIYTSKSTSTKITINGGLVKGHTNSSKTAGGIYNYTTGLTVNGGTIIGHAWTNTSYGIYLYGGSATINGGRIEATNDTINSNGTTTAIGINVAYVSNTYKGVLTIPDTSTVEVCAKARTNTAYAVNVGASSTGSVIAGGTFSAIAKTSYTARGISSEGDITISGGTFNVHTAETSSSKVTRNPCGIYSARGTVTVNGNPTFNVTSSRAYGAFAYGTIGAKGIASTKFSGTIEINGGTFNVTSTATTAYGAYAELASLPLTQKTEVAGDTIFGQHYMPGIIRITGGTFNVTATTNTAYGVVVGAAKSESGFEGAATRIPSGTITGGKFKVVSTGDATKAYAVNTSASNTALDIQGGYYNINTNLSGYVATTKSCNYYCLETTAADKASVGSDYNYKVAEAYTLTWNLNGGTVTTAGTGATVDATGTPSIPWGVGDAITAPTIVRDGYTFAGWSPEVAATMPAENTTYTAVWAEAEVTINGVTTPYAKFYDSGAMGEAWYAANASRFNPATIKLLQDVAVDEQLLYNNSFGQNCTLDLNGHTITSTTAVQSPLSINCSGSTFIITDNTDSKLGKLSMTTSYDAGVIFGAYVRAGTLQLDGGTLEVIVNSGTRQTCGVSVGSSFIMNEGTIHVNNTNGSDGRGVYSAGTVTINNGTIHVESTGNGYGFKRDGGTITVNGGKFNINGSNAYVNYASATDANVIIKGGYYNINSRLGTCVSAPYHVFNLTSGVEYDEGYRYKVARFYTITYNKGANGTGTIAAGYKAKDDNFTLSSSTFTRTGYTQTGWSESDGGAKVYELGGTYSENADLTVYPFWSAQNYTLTLNNQSATTAGTTSITVTYNSNTNLTATPAITLPTKTGYTFGGYYVGQGGSEKQVIAANGNVNASVSGITDASKNWIAATGGTIYAEWTQTVTLHDNNGGIHNGSLEVTYNATKKSGTPPTREGYMAEGYYAEPACTNKVLTTAAVWVNYSGWVEDGKWVHNGESTLYTKWIEDTHTVTVAAGANGSASPASVTAGITTPSETITATPNTGYHFDNWTIPSGVTIASGSTTSPSITINATADGKTITANFAIDNYTITYDLDGGSVASPNPTSYTVTSSAITLNNPTKTGYTFTGWTGTGLDAATMTVTIAAGSTGNRSYTATWESAIVGDKLDIVDWTATTLTLNTNGWTASGWPYTINGIEYAKDARAADRTLEIPYSGEAGEDLWITVQSGGSITNLNSYSIPFINTTAGTNASNIVYVNSGTLTISSNTSLAALYVRPEAKVNITSGTLTVGKLVMRTLPWQAAAIDGEFVASEVWYTRIAPNKRTVTGPYAPITYESSSYYQFALPRNCTAKLKDVQVSHGANTPYGNTWLLKRYNEETRAANGTGEANWIVLDKEEYIQGGVGYEMSSNSNYYREFYFPLGAVNSASIGSTTAVSFHSGAAGAQHAGWNWVASPLMSVYDNSDANPETGMKIGWLLTDGSYDQGIPEYIYPAIPFSYQTSSGQSYISFEGSSIVAAVPQRRTAVEEETVRLQWIHLDIQDTTGVGDHTSILAHPTRYEEAYKPGIDVAKQSFTASRALLYSSHAYGEMAFAGVSDSLLERGVALTVYNPTAQPLTLSMRNNNWLDRFAHVWLVDYETGVRTDLLIGDYTFDAPAGTIGGRFVLEGQFKTPQIITGNEDVQDESTKPVKYIYEDKMYIQIGDKVYDATGKLVNKK